MRFRIDRFKFLKAPSLEDSLCDYGDNLAMFLSGMLSVLIAGEIPVSSLLLKFIISCLLLPVTYFTLACIFALVILLITR